MILFHLFHDCSPNKVIESVSRSAHTACWTINSGYLMLCQNAVYSVGTQNAEGNSWFTRLSPSLGLLSLRMCSQHYKPYCPVVVYGAAQLMFLVCHTNDAPQASSLYTVNPTRCSSIACARSRPGKQTR